METGDVLFIVLLLITFCFYHFHFKDILNNWISPHKKELEEPEEAESPQKLEKIHPREVFIGGLLKI